MPKNNIKLLSSQLYTTEASESKEKAQKELEAEDPSDEQMERILANADNRKNGK